MSISENFRIRIKTMILLLKQLISHVVPKWLLGNLKNKNKAPSKMGFLVMHIWVDIMQIDQNVVIASRFPEPFLSLGV